MKMYTAMPKKRRSVFNILLLRIIIVIILFTVVTGGLMIYETENLQKRNIEIIKKENQDEIAGLMDTWYANMTSINGTFKVTFENLMQQTSRINSEIDLGNIDLYEQFNISGPDTSYIDLHVIRDSIVINTTRPALSGVNLFTAGKGYSDLLSRIDSVKGYNTEPWKIDTNTKRFSRMGCMVTNDDKYIIGVECYSRLADELTDMFANRIKRVEKGNENIVVINNYVGDEHHYSGLVQDTLIYELQDSLISRVFMNKGSLTEQFSEGGRTFIADYIFSEPENAEWQSAASVFSIVTEVAEHREVVYGIIKKLVVISLGFLFILSLVFIITTRKLRVTLKDLHLKTTLISKGNLHERVIVSGQNEFSALAEQFNSMIEQLESSQNELKQKNNIIEKNNKILHEKNEKITLQRDKIESQRNEIEVQRDLVTSQRDIILEQTRSITESIQYASRIQTAILPPDEVIKYLLPKHFILYKPKDIVSGDFYWLTHKQGEIIIVVADCTGHGVPGAFMSILGSALLKDVVNSSNILHANQILNDLREKVILSLRQTGQSGETKDGMDMSLCIIDSEKMRLQYAGAYQPLYLIRKGVLKEFKADKMPIGISSKAGRSFTNNEIKIFKNDSIYLFSDGFVDQFGGESNKKLLSVRFKKLLIDIQDNIMHDQKEILDHSINEWMGLTDLYEKHDQVDDITVVGIKI
jgi:serine phosphatase RsbU (regulator of sigma subunit)